MHDQTVRNERLSFFIESVQAVPEGWRLEGRPGYHPAHWARPGDRFDRACREDGRNERDVDLVVLELTESYVLVNGSDGNQLRPDDVVSGERLINDAGQAAERPVRSEEASRGLARILGLPAPTPGTGPDWASAEGALGVALPGDYKAFIGAYGAGLVDDHIFVCAPGAAEDWADLMRHNTYAHECVRLDFAGPEGCSGDWQLGDASRWAPGRKDVPPWFEPGDDLISWGHTGNGDFLFWHVQRGTAPDVWPVVLKERGPLWEQYRTGFCTVLAGLLTGNIQSEYLSDLLGGPHSYNR